MAALIGGAIATLLSLCVFSRVVGTNPAYRFAQSLLVGTALGYAVAFLVRSTIVPAAEAVMFNRATPLDLSINAIGLVLGLLLLTRYGRQRGSHWANYPLAVLFGIGAALALVGAVRGTLAPQILGTIRSAGTWGATTSPDDLFGVAISIVLTLVTLASFSYVARRRSDEPGAIMRPRIAMRTLHGIGRLLVLAAFGVFFAATVQTYLAALVGQVSLINDWLGTVGTWISGT